MMGATLGAMMGAASRRPRPNSATPSPARQPLDGRDAPYQPQSFRSRSAAGGASARNSRQPEARVPRAGEDQARADVRRGVCTARTTNRRRASSSSTGLFRDGAPGQPRSSTCRAPRCGNSAKFFESRRATQRGTHLAPGRPVWPNKVDSRALPASASLVGQHAFTGQGVPESFRFDVAAAQDIMPEIKLRQTDRGNPTSCSSGTRCRPRAPTSSAAWARARAAK